MELRLRELEHQRSRHELSYARLRGNALDVEALTELGAARAAAVQCKGDYVTSKSSACHHAGIDW